MKRIFLLFGLLIYIGFCYAQKSQKENLWKGTGIFILGTEKSVFNADTNFLPYINEADSNKKIVENLFQYKTIKSNPYKFGGVDFQKISLIFQKDNLLNNISIFTIYSKKNTANYLVQAENDITKLAFYLKNTLNQKGKKGYTQNNKVQSTTVYEWSKKERNISLSIYQTKIIGSEEVGVIINIYKKE